MHWTYCAAVALIFCRLLFSSPVFSYHPQSCRYYRIGLLWSPASLSFVSSNGETKSGEENTETTAAVATSQQTTCLSYGGVNTDTAIWRQRLWPDILINTDFRSSTLPFASRICISHQVHDNIPPLLARLKVLSTVNWGVQGIVSARGSKRGEGEVQCAQRTRLPKRLRYQTI